MLRVIKVFIDRFPMIRFPSFVNVIFNFWGGYLFSITKI